MSENGRLHSIDLVRLISAVAIVIIHISGFVIINPPLFPGWYFALFLNSFFRWGTPVFIMISGYFLLGKDKHSPLEFYRRRLQKLFFPLIFWNIFYYFIYTHLNGITPSLIDFTNRFMGGGTFYHLYFLELILGLYFVTPFLNHYLLPSKSLGKVVAVMMFLSFVYLVLYTWFGFPQLTNIFLWFIPYLGYYLAGYWLAHKKINFSRPLIFVVFLLPFLGALLNYFSVVRFGPYDQGLFFTHRLSPLIALPSLMIFYLILKIRSTHIPLVLQRALFHYPHLSLGIYLIHPAIIQIFVTLSPFSDFLHLHPTTWMFFTLAITICITTVVAVFFKKIPLLRRLI